MRLISSTSDMQDAAACHRSEGRVIGLVPTMGYLHEGHTSLIRLARDRSDLAVVSLFVNPLQFGPNEDYQTYPRNLKEDLRLIEEAGGEIVFTPPTDEMYPDDFSTHVHVEGLTDDLCGASRPGHFRGVTTVVTKLLAIVKPHLAVFGQKDAQQALIIRRMVRDLNFESEILIGPTIREPDGLAISSRNVYLDPEQRQEATLLYRALQVARDLIQAGERDAEKIVQGMRNLISESPSARIDYVSIVDTDRLKPRDRISGEILIAGAVHFGRARLIDNIIMKT